MITRQRPEANLKLKYRKVLELGFIGSLLIHLIIFLALPHFDLSTQEVKAKDIEILVEDIPPTEQIKRPPTPPRPSVPIPTESEEIPEDFTIESTELDLTELPPPPVLIEDRYEHYQFIPYDEAPEPIGGYGVMLANLEYPSIARKAGVEAKVVVGVLIDERGNCVKTQILSTTNEMMGFDEAAQKAVMSVKWKPAKQRDKAVKVWISIPIRFSLKGVQT